MLPVNTEAEHSMLYRTTTTLLLFIILLQWVMPWIVTNDWLKMFTPQPIILAMALSLMIGILRLPSAWSIILSVSLCAILLLWIFASESGQGGFSLPIAMDGFVTQFKALISHGIWTMSEQQRTLLLVIGWVMLAPAIQAMVWQHQLSISILGATVFYLTILHISFGMDVFTPMLLTIICGIALVAVTMLPRIRRKLMISSVWRGVSRNNIASIVLFISVILGLSYAATFEREREQKPLPAMTVMSTQLLDQLGVLSQHADGTPLQASNHSTYSSALSGFSEDDSTLGLPLNVNDTLLFTGWSSEKRYWRADAKSYYDGRGWLDEEQQQLVLRAIPSTTEEAQQLLKEKAMERGKPIVQQIEYILPVRDMPFMQAGQYGMISRIVGAAPQREIYNYIANEQLDTLLPPTDELLVSEYEVTSWLPIEDERQLSKIELEQEVDQPAISRLWEKDSLAPYLQLPEQLPARVSALASEISGGGMTSRYDRVKAVEQYLKNNYTYTMKSQLPQAGEDFVDNFLFQQQSGYCVHFSSAMVILLRSQQIPARWVKGFTSGKAVDDRQNEAGIVEVKYEVSNADAHAWVEVYFPTVGWVPFDPTPQASSESHALWGPVEQFLQKSIDGVSKFSASLTWIHALAGIGAIIFMALLFILVRLYWNLRYRRQYAQYYHQYMKFSRKQNDYILRQKTGVLPPRSKTSFKQMEEQKRILQGLNDSFCHCAEIALQIPRHTANGAWITWREQIARLGHLQTIEQQQQLQSILSKLEQLHYAANGLQNCEWPTPKEWNKQLNQISMEQRNINKPAKGNTWRMKLQFSKR